MEIYNGILCISGDELIKSERNPEGVLSLANYNVLKNRGKINVLRRASYSKPVLVEFDSLPTKYKDAFVARHGNPRELPEVDPWLKSIKPDAQALTYFSTRRLADGRRIPPEKVQEYCANAAVLNALHAKLSDLPRRRRANGMDKISIWPLACELAIRAKVSFKHKLPENEIRLKDKYLKYINEGYASLISNKFGNSNSRKVTEEMERLILSLYCRPEKPYASTVHLDYLQFLAGNIEIVDYKTGEIFQPDAFINDDGTPLTVSEGTIWNIVNEPKNAPVVGMLRNDKMAYNNSHRPHHHRHRPQFALSKISMDDRDLPRKMADGNRVKAYYAYDVASGAIIGAAYSKRKDKPLFIACMRDMFINLTRMGMGLPLELEVEHHIVNEFADDLMKAGIVFPFVRWCNPGNSQEKRAEHLNREKKYGYEKRYQEGIGRWYAKLEANRTRSEKVFDESNDNWKEKTYSFEQLVAEDRKMVELYNNDKRKNMSVSRVSYLKENINPAVVAKIDKPLLVRYIGEKTDCSVVRNQYVKVQYCKYALPDPHVVERLEPGDNKVEAYYMPGAEIEEVYIYQEETYICTAAKLAEYNEATAEQTDHDRQIYTEQSKYVSQYDKMVKERARDLAKVVIQDRQRSDEIANTRAEEVVVVDQPKVKITKDAEYYRQLAKDNL